MNIIITVANDSLRESRGQARGPLGIAFVADPYQAPKGNFMDALAKFNEKHPYRAARKGEKTSTQLLREARDSR